jgi:hypothetical protein
MKFFLHSVIAYKTYFSFKINCQKVFFQLFSYKQFFLGDNFSLFFTNSSYDYENFRYFDKCPRPIMSVHPYVRIYVRTNPVFDPHHVYQCEMLPDWKTRIDKISRINYLIDITWNVSRMGITYKFGYSVCCAKFYRPLTCQKVSHPL